MTDDARPRTRSATSPTHGRRRGLDATDGRRTPIRAAGCCSPAMEPGSASSCTTPPTERHSPMRPSWPASGCGNPIAVAELREGETVLDLGSGGGIDVLLSAQRVGPTGSRVRPRHDRRDARARPAQRRRGRRDERRVPQGHDRVASRSATRASTSSSATASSTSPRTRPPSSPRSPASCGRAAGSGISDIVADDLLTPERARRARQLRRLHRRRAVVLRVPGGPAGRRPGDVEVRRPTRSPRACTRRSSAPRSLLTGRR